MRRSRLTRRLGVGSALLLLVFALGVIIAGDVIRCGGWQAEVRSLAKTRDAYQRGEGFSSFTHLNELTDKLTRNAHELGDNRPTFCSVPDEVKNRESAMLFWLIDRDGAERFFKTNPPPPSETDSETNEEPGGPAKQLTFQVFAPRWIPGGYETASVSAWADPAQMVGFNYAGEGVMTARVVPVRPQPRSTCEDMLPDGDRSSCRGSIARKDRVIYLLELDPADPIWPRAAVTFLGRTRVSVMYSELTDQEAIRYLDSFRPVDAGDLRYFDRRP